MNQVNPQGQNPQDIKVVFKDEADKAGVYSNAVSVHITANEVVLDFGYSVPNTKDPHEIMITSRVNMNHRAAEQFLGILGNSLNDFKAKVKEMQDKMQQGGSPIPPQA